MTATAILVPVALKTCGNCGCIKSVDEFFKSALSKDGRCSHCKDCRKEYHKAWYAANRDSVVARSRANYQKMDKARRRSVAAAWEEKNKERNRAAKRQYARDRRESDPIFQLARNTASLIRVCILGKRYTKRSRTHEILGCDWEFFKSHIERQFLKGMAWGNRSEWHIDHIVPMSTAATYE